MPRKMTPALGGADRRTTDASSSGVPIRSARVWRRLASPLSVASASVSMSRKTRKTGARCSFAGVDMRPQIQQAPGPEFGARADSEPRRYRSAASYCRREEPHDDAVLWRPTPLSAPMHKGVVNDACPASLANTPSLAELAVTSTTNSVVTEPAHACSCRSLSRVETITYDNAEKRFACSRPDRPPLLMGALSEKLAREPRSLDRNAAATYQRSRPLQAVLPERLARPRLCCPMPTSNGS